MSPVRRFAIALAVVLALGAGGAPAALADAAPGGDDNAAVAVNTEDGASVFRLAFSVRMVANGVVDDTNTAWALASCTDCQTVALALQVVLVWGDANVAVPENQAVAYNDQCVECVTYASATQIVLGFDGPVRFTDEGRRRLTELERTLEGLEKQVDEMSFSELVAAINAAKAELVAILEEELVAVPAEATGEGGTTTSTAPADTTTTTAQATPTTSSVTSSTSVPQSSTTTAAPTTSSTAVTTTTSAPATTTTTTTTTAPAPSTTVAG